MSPQRVTVLCAKLGPMEWEISVPGRAPFRYWVYVLVGPDGVEHSESFTCTYLTDSSDSDMFI